MTDYLPRDPKIYAIEELEAAIECLKYLHELCNRGDIDQHTSPGLLVAIDCVSKEREQRGA